jgi:predicted dehydrogenase
MAKRKIRMGMIGGGTDAFIGSVHRLAAFMDGQVELVCGALSINPEIAKSSAQLLYLPEDRTYLNYEEMITTSHTLRLRKWRWSTVSTW